MDSLLNRRIFYTFFECCEILSDLVVMYIIRNLQ